MNAMLYVRGRPLDYDLWEAQGAAGWGWDDVRPYFLQAEDNERGASEHHAVGGPLHVADERSPRPLTRALPAGRAEAAGMPVRRRTTTGPSRTARPRAGHAARRPALEHRRRLPAPGARPRPNLEVVTGAHVIGLALEGGRAVGRALPRPPRARAGGRAPSAR